MLQIITNVDSDRRFYFDARTPYEAMLKLKDYLGTKELIINKTESNTFLYSVFKGETYAIKLNGE